MKKREKKNKLYTKDGDPIIIDSIKYYFYKMQYYNNKGELKTRNKTMKYRIPTKKRGKKEKGNKEKEKRKEERIINN